VTAQVEYSQRSTQAESDLQFACLQFQRTWLWFLVTFAALLATLYLFYLEHAISSWSVPATAFALTAVMKNRGQVAARMQTAKRKLQFYRDGLARLACQYPPAGENYQDAAHLYTKDLNVFGGGSLYSLMATPRTGAGQNTLAGWLSQPAGISEVLSRQEAVEELRAQLDLRERIALIGAAQTESIDPTAVHSWLDRPAAAFFRWARTTSFAVSALAVITGLFALAGLVTPRAFLFSLAPEIIVAGVVCHRVRTIIESIALPALDLGILGQLLLILESQVFTSPLLRNLQARLNAGSIPASVRVSHLRRMAELLDLRRNDVFGYLSYMLLWGTQFAIAIENWRAVFGEDLRRWLAAAGEFEALNSIASYAYEHPSDPFPELLDTQEAVFEAEALGHPMIPEEACVRNDICLNRALQVLVVSGSNMSGKSTFLRAVGLNVVLARAGAPVRARHLRVSPLAVGAAIQMEDSLETGKSRFAAEVLRVRRIMDLAASAPTLFLLDEVLSGTNSRDRRIGAEIIIRYLLDRGAIGLVTTHDLSLTEIADALHPRGANIYFEDSFLEGEMAFDYQARSGVLTRSNALALMRSLGIEV
jgi:hypothetical protein